MLVLLLLIGVAGACTTDSVYEDCIANPTCHHALWQPTVVQFERLVLHLPLNCSSPSPSLDLAVRVRSTYECPRGEYGSLDTQGTFSCTCPAGQSCDEPSSANFALTVMFGLIVIAFAFYVRFPRAKDRGLLE